MVRLRRRRRRIKYLAKDGRRFGSGEKVESQLQENAREEVNGNESKS
jgi:hypothetical protein